MFKLIKYLKDFRKEVILGPIFKLIEAIFELMIPLVVIQIIDVGVKNSDMNYILKMGGLMVLLGLVGFLCSVVCQRYAAIASQGFGTTLRNAVFEHINTFSHKEVDRFGTPSLVTRLTSDINQLQLSVAMFIRLVIRAPFLILGSVVMAMLLDLKLSIIFLVATPVIFLVLYLVMSRSVPYFEKIQKKLDDISLDTRENLSGTRVIRAFSKQESEMDNFKDTATDFTNSAVRVGKISSLLNPLTYMIINISIIAIIWFGGLRVDSGAMTQGQIFAYVNYMSQILLALIIVANLVVIFTKAAASARRITEILNVDSDIQSNKDSKTLELANIEDKETKIEFKDVSFGYVKTKGDIIKDINVKINKNDMVGIIGATGSGKSTLINLVPRFYDANKGQVLVNEIDVKDYPVKDLRDRIGIVPQNAELFKGTIAENVRWGKEDASEEEIIEALKIAQAWEFVEGLSNKLESQVSQGGQNLSGGQKQRLTIARALVSKPEIIILDDSSSALDLATDAALRDALAKKTKASTVIVVSQRVSSIKNSDKIIVLNKGLVAGVGTHEQLLKESDVYMEIYQSQTDSEEVSN